MLKQYIAVAVFTVLVTPSIQQSPDISSILSDYKEEGPDTRSALYDYKGEGPDISSALFDYKGEGPDNSSALFDYKGEGPDTRSALYDYKGADWPGLCESGHAQSPIAIDVNKISDIMNGYPLEFINYAFSNFTNEPSKTTINLVPERSNLKVGLTSGGLRGFYVMAAAHFHWASEHLLNNKRSDLELHIVHYKSVYGSVDEAKKHRRGLAVLAVFFKMGPPNPAINQVMELVKGNKVTLTAKDLLPPDTNEYFRYDGSLTTPDCDESVIWTVFKSKNTISQEQINWFRNIPINAGAPVKNNYREVQKIRRRKIYHVLARDVYY